MKLLLLEKNRILKTQLPSVIEGNYWITDEEHKNLVNVEARIDRWIIKSNSEVKLVAGESDTATNKYEDEMELFPHMMYYILNTNNDTLYKIYCDPDYDDTFRQFKFSYDVLDEFIIGNSRKSTLGISENIDVDCTFEYFAKNQISIEYKNNHFFIKNLNPRLSMYVNDTICEEKLLENGELVFIEGLKFCFIGDYFLINKPEEATVNALKFFAVEAPTMDDYDFSNRPENYVELFKKEDYFQRPPRINKSIETKEIKIDPAPQSQNGEEMPFIFTMGTMLTMGATSMLTGLTAVAKISSGEATVKQQLPSLITCGAMLIGMILFPIIRSIYTKFRRKKKEKLRQKTYRAYLQEKKKEILDEINYQQQVLLENNLSPIDCSKVILNKERNLWERKLDNDDFLCVRLGLGTLKPRIVIKAPEEHFMVEKDDLIEEMHKTVEALKDMENVPIVIDLKERICSAFIGEFPYVSQFIDNIMLELLTTHTYDLLKIVVLTNEANEHVWEKYKNTPYLWNNEKTIRFIGSNSDDIMEISNYLTEVYNARTEFIQADSLKESNFKSVKPYYLIITDSMDSIENLNIINTILGNKTNYGFSLLINTDKIDSLPNQCSLFVNLEPNNCAVYEQQLIANRQISFKPDPNCIDLDVCIRKICNIPVDIADGKFLLPPSYDFLQMYDVGNVNQLNSINRWKDNNIINSLQAPIGINEQGELFKLDIHEKYHGPHGLVAGMTGAGKSEWLITYILSMSINYHPDEVQFVLIDYKGGGLAGVFENRETGFKLPHLAGTITNLDVVEINRALASIRSELKRRQQMFNAARDKLNESTIDIYKYQRLYREGKVEEPMSHLIIISDEFAELKAQQPEFMGELISTARIGRSLGVHLILATQKPSGVVDDQIWSNAKFRACLKVQDKSDSNDMLKRPDAAMIKEPGRFFLQVGFNEYFAKGQAAYAGGPYYESDKRKMIVDTSVEFVNELGYRYKIIETKRNIVEAVHKGDELPNILAYIKETADKTETHVRKLWLDRIPNVIYHDSLKTKYGYKKEEFNINPIIGEYDAPELQEQGLLTLKLTEEGNALFYGISGSGKENLLCNLIYSLILNYTVNEINLYILDFGAEILMAFRNAPHVGDILRSGDDEKITNLFKLLRNTLEERKNLFQEYNGDIKTYSTTSGKTVPNMVIVINNMENFLEFYPDFMEELVGLTRDGSKYGILFIGTTNGVNNVRLKLAQNYPIQIALQLKDKYDYTSVLGNTGGIVPSKVKGRGLVKVHNKIYEFQSAYVTDESKQIEFIKKFSKELKDSTLDRAKRIPILPKIVNYDFVDDSITDLSKVPIAVSKDTLEIIPFDLISKEGVLVSSNDFDLLIPFTESLLYLLGTYKNTNVFVIDATASLENVSKNVKYFSNNFESVVTDLNKFISSIDPTTSANYANTLFVFLGLNNIMSSLDATMKKDFQTNLLKIDKINKFNIILIDQVADIKKLEFDSWYKDTINATRGIWLGNGIDNQFSLKLTRVTRELREDIPEGFGYIIEKGKPYLAKLINIKESDFNEQQ